MAMDTQLGVVPVIPTSVTAAGLNRAQDIGEGETQPPKVDSALETSLEGEEAGLKQRRRRVKGVLKKVQEQLEFYFGDANLSRDKFLKEKMAEHAEGYVSIDLIASFNKMRSLTTDRNLIVSAMERSTLLQVSLDKDMVRRVSPLYTPSEDEITARTVYVESIPPQSTHDQLQRLFKQFGTITYVSLPRHKPTGNIKGFAFIEFSTPEEAHSAVEFFKSEEKPQAAPVESHGEPTEDSVFVEKKTDSDDRMKRKREEEENENKEKAAKKLRVEDDSKEERTLVGQQEKNESGQEKVEAGQERISQKVTLMVSEGGAPLVPGCSPTHLESTPDKPSDEARKRRRESESSVEDETVSKTLRLDSTFSETSIDGESSARRKKRMHKKKRRASVVDQLKGLNLRVMSKLEWLEMKQLFKQLQKDQMKKLKEENRTEGPGVNIPRKFVTNCLVKVVISKGTAVTKEQLKEHCSKHGSIAYVDIADDQLEGYVRYASSGCVEKLTAADAMEGITFTAASEEEEKAYYLKTRINRRQKSATYSATNKRKTTRGHDKVITKSLQKKQQEKKEKKKAVHTRFSGSDDDSDHNHTRSYITHSSST